MLPATSHSDVITLREAASILKCSPAQVSKLTSGKVMTKTVFPYFPIGRRKYSRRSWLEKWMEENRA